MKTKLLTAITVLIFATNAQSQTAPGGVGNLTGASKLRLWLRSDFTYPSTNGSLIDTLYDKSGANNHLVSIGAARPTLSTNIVNGHGTINFAGAQFMQKTPANSHFDTTETTFFTVISNNATKSVLSVAVSGISSEYLMLDQGMYHHTSSGNFVQKTHQCSGAFTGSFAVICAMYGTTPTDINEYFNGLASTNTNTTAGGPVNYSIANRFITLGQRQTFTAGEYLTGKVVEVIGYRGKLSTAERNAVEQYLYTKYNLSNSGCGVLNVAEAQNNFNLQLYPNPAFNTLTITNENNVNFDCVLINALGQNVKSFKTDGITQTIDVSNLNEGIYFLNILEKSKVVSTKKIIISR